MPLTLLMVSSIPLAGLKPMLGTVEVNSGDLFEVGDTLVTCNTSDAAGNTAMCGFNVTVIG